MILTLLLWLSLVILIFPPSVSSNENLDKIGVKDDVVPSDFITKIKDSLGLKKVVSISEYEKEYTDKNLDIKLIGQNFEGEFLSHFSDKNVSFYPYFKTNELHNLTWRAVLRQNETQEINGAIELDSSKNIWLKFGSQTLDSLKLAKGKQQFHLSFPSFSLGKTAVKLYLDKELQTEIKFYSRAMPKLRILVLAENPDFETKTLSEWLGKNGHSVEVETIVTKNTQNKTNINEAKKGNFDLVFTTAGRVNNAICIKTLKEGGGVFVFNIAEKDVAFTNKTLGSAFSIQRISPETESKLSNDLLSLPFKIKENKNQQNLKNWPISISNKKIGLSLITETFPLILSGDSITYRKIWGGVLQLLQPAQKNNIEIKAPILQDLYTSISFNNFEKSTAIFPIDKDSIFTKTNPINPYTKFGNYVFRKTGWQKITDSLEVFVNDSSKAYSNQKFVKTILSSYNSNSTPSSTTILYKKETLPEWIRLLICILLFVIIWIEAKW